MKYGGSKLTMVNAPSEVIDIIMGCVIIIIAISHVFKKTSSEWKKEKGGKINGSIHSGSGNFNKRYFDSHTSFTSCSIRFMFFRT